jgi:hypothetical protein
MRWHDDFHPAVDDFHPEVGYLLPSRAFRRTVRMAAFAAAIGAIVGASATALLLKPRIPDVSVRPPDAAQPMEAGPGKPETAPPATSSAFVQLARRPCGSRTWARVGIHCRAGSEPDPLLVEETSRPEQAAALPHPSVPPTFAAPETADQKTASPKKPKIVDATKLKPLRDIYYNARDAYATPFWGDANRPYRNRFHSGP